jgi:probable addiction module antidote protein
MIKKPKTVKKSRCVDYHDSLIERLKDRDYAVAYINAAIEEGSKGDSESKQLFLNALRNVAEAQGSVSALAKRARVRRESVYRMLSKNGNPELSSFTALLHAMGFDLYVR